jgi:rubrerythrin
MKIQELVNLLDSQIEIERRAVEEIGKTVKMTKNSAFRLLLNKLVLDSQRHVDMLLTIKDLAAGSMVSLSEKGQFKRAIENHLRDEEEMLRRIREAAKRIDEPQYSVLVKHILSDERRHHEMLKDLQRVLEWKTETDQQWWDLLNKWEWLY